MATSCLNRCPVTMGLETTMSRETFEKLCRSKRNEKMPGNSNKIYQYEICQHCQGKDIPGELSFGIKGGRNTMGACYLCGKNEKLKTAPETKIKACQVCRTVLAHVRIRPEVVRKAQEMLGGSDSQTPSVDVQALENENMILKARLSSINKDVTIYFDHNNQLTEQLESTQEELDVVNKQLDELDTVKTQLSEAKKQIDEMKRNLAREVNRSRDMEKELLRLTTLEEFAISIVFGVAAGSIKGVDLNMIKKVQRGVKVL